VHAFSHEVGATWKGKPVGLLFVDADHSYAGARQDIEVWSRHLAPGAVIAVDDYGHPDWPGVKEAVDALVDEGFLAPIEVFHDRLAVTALAGKDRGEIRAAGAVTAITSEGVSPSPVAAGKAETVDLDPVELAFDSAVSSSARRRDVVHAGELEGVPGGAPIGDLNTVQLRALAKVRGISLGARKDKRSEMLQALEAGE
jgi:hypothetical protein